MVIVINSFNKRNVFKVRKGEGRKDRKRERVRREGREWVAE